MNADERYQPGRSALRGVERGRHDFAKTVRADRELAALCERGGSLYRPFEAMLSDVFGFFLTPEASLDPNSGCDRLQYLILNYLVESPEYGALRHRTAANNLASLAATEEFGNRFLEYIGRAQIAERANEHGGLDPAAPVPIEKIIFADYAVTADGDSSNAVLLILAKHVEGTVESTRLLADVCHTWGIEPGAMRATPWADRAALGERMKQSPSLRRFAELVGRWRVIARARKAKRTPRVSEEIQDVTLGDDWPLLIPQELAALAHPLLRFDFYRRLIDRQLYQYDPQARDGRGKGPVLVCLDTSGSMAGARDIAAKAAALAILEIARKERRPFAAILFSSKAEWISFVFHDSQVTVREPSGAQKNISLLEGIFQTATFFFGGGTDYQSPLTEAARLIESGRGDWRNADIVFITDDYCDVTPEFVEEFERRKRTMDVKVFSVIVGARADDARTLRKFSDRVLSAEQFDESVMEQIFDAI